MRPNTLKLSLVLALSLATLAACDKHGKKSEDAGASQATNPVAVAPATTPSAPATATPATADAAGGKKAWKGACAEDVKKFCADADKPGKCLKQHESELSQACSAARAARKAAHEAQKADKAE